MSFSPELSNGKSATAPQQGAFIALDKEEPSSKIFSANRSTRSDATINSDTEGASHDVEIQHDTSWYNCRIDHIVSNMTSGPHVSPCAKTVSATDAMPEGQTTAKFDPDIPESMGFNLNEKDSCKAFKTQRINSDFKSSQNYETVVTKLLCPSKLDMFNHINQGHNSDEMDVVHHKDHGIDQPLSCRQSRGVGAINLGAVQLTPLTLQLQERDHPEPGTHPQGFEVTGYQGIAAQADAMYDTTMQGNLETFQDNALEDVDDPKVNLQRYHHCRLRFYMFAICLFYLVILALIVGFVVLHGGLSTSWNNNAPTFAPTSLQDSLYFQQFAQSLGYQEWDFTLDSPYGRAAKWIMEEDERNLSELDTSLTQRFLMAVLYFITTSNGEYPWLSCNPDFTNSSNENCDFEMYTINEKDKVAYYPKPLYRWLSKVHECDWAGNVCDEFNVTRAIHLFGQNITGKLPTEVVAFPLLQSIGLAYNKFTGTLPIEYLSPNTAPHLINLEVHGNHLTGTIPKEYYFAKDLLNLNIGQNYLSGSLTSEIGLLTSLKGFHTFSNMMTGSIPTEIGRLKYLTYTRHNENMYNGTIPTEFGNLLQIKELWLDMNYLTGSIPSELGLLTDMTDLLAFQNKLEGTIPPQLYSLSKLNDLALDANFLSGSISSQIANLRAINGLWLSRNQLTGTIPTELARLSLLELLWLHMNKLVGSVPTEMCELMSRDVGRLFILQADCFPEWNKSNPCSCCTACCNRDTEVCLVLDANDPNT